MQIVCGVRAYYHFRYTELFSEFVFNRLEHPCFRRVTGIDGEGEPLLCLKNSPIANILDN